MIIWIKERRNKKLLSTLAIELNFNFCVGILSIVVHALIHIIFIIYCQIFSFEKGTRFTQLNSFRASFSFKMCLNMEKYGLIIIVWLSNVFSIRSMERYKTIDFLVAFKWHIPFHFRNGRKKEKKQKRIKENANIDPKFDSFDFNV